MRNCISLSTLLIVLCAAPGQVQRDTQQTTGPLASWKDGPTKTAILDFVQATTAKGSPKFVPAAERIATFDNDGTLWVEHPIYAQAAFVFDRVKALAPSHRDWLSKEPFKAVVDGNREALAKLTKKELLELVAATHAGMTLDHFRATVKDWLQTAKHPRFKRPYTECVYQPMLEVMSYLRERGFKVYIVSGGGQEFIRGFSERVYGVPPEQVIGSAIRTKYTYQEKRPVLLRLPTLLLLDDEDGKPEDIELFIGRKPLAAFGNSDGDRQMLEWTESGPGARLMMLVHHDDAQREYAYGPKSKVGTFSDALMAEAKQRSWTVISMKNDWRRVFPFDAESSGP
jgi:phosphoglycolate phosphatase-like HAD superfamily hydrolase